MKKSDQQPRERRLTGRRIGRRWLLLVVFLLLAGGAGAVAYPLGLVTGAGVFAGLPQRVIAQTYNYDEMNKPFYLGNYVGAKQADAAELVVVTYNLRYGEKIAEAIDAYRGDAPLPEADIVLLQEMDEASVSTIARALGYNYVYYPASVAEDGDDFGNAILARWPISDPAKLILPGLHPLTGQQRTATRAVVHVGDTDVLAYSTHIEVAAAPRSLREAQFAAVIDDIPDDAPYVIVGGDFNTITGRGVDALAGQFAAAGLDHASAELGPTFTRFGLRPSATDHIFSRGFALQDAGVLPNITASDHFPVWARFGRPPGSSTN